MAIVPVQVAGVQSSGAVASLGATYSSNVTSGSLLVATVIHYQVAAYTVTDGTNTWVQDITRTLGNDTASIWSVPVNGASGSLTVTVTNTGGNQYTTLGIFEATGQATSSLVFNTSGADNTTTTAFTSGALTPDTDGCLFIGAMTHNGSGTTQVPDSPFSTLYREDSASNEPACSSYYVQPTAASQAATFTLGAARDGPVVLAVYRPAAGGGGTPVAVYYWNLQQQGMA